MSANTSIVISFLSTLLIGSFSSYARMQRRVNRLHTGLNTGPDDRGIL